MAVTGFLQGDTWMRITGKEVAMSSKKEKKIDLDNLTPEESLKLEIAAEIGVYDKVLAQGWRSLTAKESGRIGGMMTRRKRAAQKAELTEQAGERDPV